MLNTKKRWQVFLLISFIILVLTGLAVKSYVHTRRHYIFCELLKPGMTREEVDDVLLQIGPYNKRTFILDENRIHIYFESFIQNLIVGQDLTLLFNNNIYKGATITVHVSDIVAPVVCSGKENGQ